MHLSRKIRGLKEMLSFDNRWQLVLSRLLFRGTSLVVYRLKGCEFLVNQHAGDVNGIRKILTTRMYSQFLDQLEGAQDKPLNVFDLGSHVGGFPILLHLHGFNINRLSCVELNPATYTRMCFNIANNLKCGFVPVHGAVGGERRQLSLHLGQGSTSDSIYAKENSWQESSRLSPCTVEGWTFDDLSRKAFPNDDAIDICKIDVEGAEYDIVLGSSSHQTIRRCVYLIMEIHPHNVYSASQLFDRLAEYKIVPIAHDTKENVFLFKNDGLSCGGSSEIKS
jgi:FkbM family methyltransferase